MGVVDVDDPDAKDFRIKEEIIHEEYSPLTKYNDLALLRLDRNVTITLHLRPACLATDRAERNRRATVTGWGKTGRGGSSVRLTAVNVLEVMFNDLNCFNSFRPVKRAEQGIAGRSGRSTDLRPNVQWPR